MPAVSTLAFVERWSFDRCKVEVGGIVYDIVAWTVPVNVKRFTARRDGVVVGERARFSTLLRDLNRLSAQALSSVERLDD